MKQKTSVTPGRIILSRLKQQYCYLSQIKVNEMLRFMRDVAPEISAADAMPSGIVFLVELFLNVSSNVLFNIVLFKCLKKVNTAT